MSVPYRRAVRVPCVGAVIFDRQGRLLVVRRGHPPAQGLWSIP
ncbi:MAG: NUDIX domain-containing protein, partial [Nocardioidaceae bacterium]